MTTPNDSSDKALAVLAFAVYHQLKSGDVVTSIAPHDKSGHQANPAAVEELTGLGLLKHRDDRLHFTDAGQVMLSQTIDRIRGSW